MDGRSRGADVGSDIVALDDGGVGSDGHGHLAVLSLHPPSVVAGHRGRLVVSRR